MSMRILLIRGMVAGLAAAVVSLLFAWIFGEPQINLAITVEEHHVHDAGAAADPELVSRTVQQTLGLATGLGLFGVAMGGLFAVSFAIAYSRIGQLSARATSAIVAGAGFAAVSLIPSLKYPANPPGVGAHDTVGSRSGLYVILIAVSVAIVVVSAQVTKRLAVRVGHWNAALSGAALAIALVAIAYLLLPEVNEVPPEFPATVLWQFRIASLGTHAVFWIALGLGFGALTERRLGLRRQAVPASTT
ncbi:CbtA family protein [Microtetraspora malaysiensis]|uniref:CbtA family protein n=1 Tax=Microtetraspora malaysiensis TaxID=161358 RepID=UPI003D91F3AC